MKKKTLNAIMQGVMIVLVLAIIVVSIKLILRPESEEIPSEVPVVEDYSESESIPEVISEETTEQQTYTRVRILKDNINVRSGPGTDYERLGSAYGGYDFEFVEQTNDEWTKIIYDGKEAYIFTEYVELVEMYLNVDGKYVDVPN
ncbi:MAG: SH3 domain-containing protein [Lachnospiraceae bacterium]|nr:SH3 domain-containing protein [Lachnospiraceae bacterium]